jgi:hypothetical protein
MECLMADSTGGTPPVGSSPFDPPQHYKDAYDHFGDVAKFFAVATAANLPASGNWNGRRLWVLDTQRLMVWNGSAWVRANSRAPYGRMGYAERTSTTTINATTSSLDVPGLAVTFTAEAGRTYRVAVNALLIGSVSGDRSAMAIQEGSTVLQSMSNFLLNTAGSAYQLHMEAIIVSPSAGSHTYKVTIRRSSGTGNVNMYSASDGRAFILVEDIGPST